MLPLLSILLPVTVLPVTGEGGCGHAQAAGLQLTVEQRGNETEFRICFVETNISKLSFKVAKINKNVLLLTAVFYDHLYFAT